jgi:hypothetical protein
MERFLSRVNTLAVVLRQLSWPLWRPHEHIDAGISQGLPMLAGHAKGGLGGGRCRSGNFMRSVITILAIQNDAT